MAVIKQNNMSSKIKKLNQEVNFKNRKQRINLYNRTFMNHNVESRLFTLQKEAINLTTQVLAVALDPKEANLLNLAEAVGDVETCIEFVKLSIPKLQEASVNIRQRKLSALKNRTDGIDEAKKLEGSKDVEGESIETKSSGVNGKFYGSLQKKKSFLDYLLFWRNW